MILHLLNAALMMNMQAIVRGASLEKTAKSSVSFGHFGLRFRLDMAKRIPIMAKAVTSTLIFSRTNATIVRIRRTKTVIISNSIEGNNFMAWVYNKFYVI